MHRICPNPPVWDAVFKKLCSFAERNNCMPPQPPVPLILAGWAYTSDADKMERWNQTVAWAEENACSDLVQGIGDGDFYTVGDVSSGAVGPGYEQPQGATLSVTVTEPPASAEIATKPQNSDEPDDADDEDDLDDDRDGVDRCPICGRRNQPLAADVCSDFLGIVFDGSDIGTPVGDLISAWSRLAFERVHEAPRAVLIALGSRIGVSDETIDLFLECAEGVEGDRGNGEILENIMGTLGIEQGELITQAEGMLSGSWYAIYCSDPEGMRKLASESELVSKAISS
jgi:hypothetical protein